MAFFHYALKLFQILIFVVLLSNSPQWGPGQNEPLSALLSEARATADDTSQDEQDFIQVQNKRKRFRNQNERNSISETVRPIVITIKPKPTQKQFARAMKTKLPQLKIQRIRELPNSDFFIQPESKASRDSLMSNTNLQQLFLNANVNTRNTLPKRKSKPSFVIVNMHHSIQENEIKEELLSNNGMNVVKVSRIISRSIGKPTKLIRVIKDSTNHVLAAQKHSVKTGWLIYRCEPSKDSPHAKQCFKCRKYGHSAIECKDEQRCCDAQASTQ